jgi:hypothetical protein
MPEEISLPSAHAVGFFSSAPLPDEGTAEQAFQAELQRLQKLHEARLLAVSPLVAPGDLRFTRQALESGLPLVLLLLKQPRDLLRDFPETSRNELEHILQKAASVEIIHSSTDISNTIHLAQRLVDQIDFLIVLQNPEHVETDAEMISYAVGRGRTVINLTASPGAPEPGALTVDDTARGETMEQLCATLGTPPPEPAIPDEVRQYFEACDEEATRTAPEVRRYVLNIVLANALASMAGSVGSSFKHSAAIGYVLTGIKFGAILLGLAIFAVLRHRESQNHWLKLRLKAEICRSMMATWNSPRLIEPISADDLPEMSGLIRSLHYLRVTHAGQPEPTLDAFKAHYGWRRLAHQYSYFETKSESARRTSSYLTPLYWIFSGAALITSGAAIVVQSAFHLGTWGNFFFVFVPIVTPILASWVLAWQAIESVSRKKIRFAEMKRLMQQAMIDLIHCHSWEAVHHVVKRTEKVLLNEVLEWYSFVKLK